MKHFRLLLALLTLIAGGVSVSAQTWTADAVGEGYYALYNVGADAYLQQGNAWGSQASYSKTNPMIVELTGSEGKFMIRTAVNDNAYGLENLVDAGAVYTDQSRDKVSTWTFTNVGTTEAPVYNIISAENHGGGSGAYLTASSSATTVVEGTDGTSDYAKWKLMKVPDGAYRNEIITAMASATEENPVDATQLIADAQFGAAGNIASQFWTIVASDYKLHAGIASNATAPNPVGESWCSTFTLSQTIEVPNGYYKVRAQGFIREYNETGADYPVVYINDATKPFVKMVTETASLADVSNYFANGDNGVYYFTDWTDPVTVTDKKITVGARGTRTDTWCAWDNFQLQYLGPIKDLSAYAADLAAAVATAEATEGTIPAAAYNEIAAVVTANNKTYDKADDYTAAIQAINNAVARYASTEIVSAYSQYLTLKTDVQALYDVTGYEELTEGAHEILGTALTTATTNVETCTEIALINDIAATLKAAGATYAGNANPTGEAQFNLTFMLTNPNLEGMPIRAKAEGWYTDQKDGNSQVMTNAAATSEDGTKTAFYEYWSNPAKANNEFALYQKVTLPPGTFDISCYAFAQDQYAGQNSVGVYFYANDTQGSSVSTNRLTQASLSFINDAEQEVKIGLKTTTGNTYNWMGIGYVQLYKVPASTTTYAINVNATNATVITTVDGEETTEALALKTVTLNVSADEGCAITVTATYTDGGTETALEVANPENGVYTFQMPEHDVNVTVVAVVDKTALAAAITAAGAFTEGTLPSSVYTTLTEALATANNVNSNSEATVAEVAAATTALEEAITTANVVKAPFNRYNTIKAAVVAVNEAVDTAEADNKANTASTAEGIENAIATVRTALKTYLTNNATAIFNAGNPIDVTTALIDNASPTSNANYWEVSVQPNAFDPGNNCTEFWGQKGATLSQTLAAMPIGNYQLKVVALTRTNYDASIFANDNSKAIVGVGSDVVNNRGEANTWFNNENGINTLDFTTVSDADLTIGLKAASNTSDYWTVWRNFQLFYHGVDLSLYQQALSEVINTATALEGKIPSQAYSNLMNVVNENNQPSTLEEYNSSIAAIQTAIETANPLVTPYSLYQIAKTNVVAIKSQTTYTDEGGTATTKFDANVAAADQANEQATTVEAINAAINQVRIAASTFAGTVSINQGQYLDLTDALLFNADMRTDGCLDLWNIVSNTNPEYPKYRVNCSEFWGANFNFNQTALQMPKGNYNIEVYAFHRAPAEGSTYHTYLYANDESVLVLPITNGENTMEAAAASFDQGLYLNSLKITLDEASDVVIGFKNEDTEEDLRENNGQTYPTDKWTIFRDFKIKFFGDDALAVYREEYESALAEAETALSSEEYTNISGEERTALSTAVTETYPKSIVETDETQEKFEAATTALKDATTAFKNTKAAYDAYAAVKAATVDYKTDYPYASAEKLAAYQANLGDVTNATEATTTATAIVRTYRLYVESNALAEGVEGAVVMTDQILNNNNPENTDNWTAELNLGENVASFVINSGQPYTAGDGTTDGKYFDGGAATWGNGNWEAKISQDIMLAPGKYVLSVTSRAQANVNKYNLFAGENKVEMGHIGSAANAGIFGNGFNDYYVEFDVTAENPTVTIGIEVGATEAYTWYSFSRFRLVQLVGDADQAGDVNGDTKVDVADITAMVNIIVANGYEKAADLDGDNDVDTEDVKALVNLVLGKE